MKSNSNYLLKGERAELYYWEACCQYAQLLHENKMHVARYLKNRDGCYVTEQEGFVFTLERVLTGQELTCMTDALFYELGSLLGEQHNVSLQLKSPFTTATSWSLFGGNATEKLGDYDENELSFFEFRDYYQSHPLYATIESLYLGYRKVLQRAWAELPQGAVQGDFCYYNMVKEENGKLGIFDFNLAGNEVYLNEAVAVAVYHAWHAPYEGNLTEQERSLLFLASYTAERPFIESERVLLPILKSVIRAFRFDRVEAGVSLDDEQKRNEFVQETLDILREA
ncbi:phosphotransferase [Sporosarcina gallistercoris]|uniref:phosphotransferase enzyme family protein n=1 Tax=Sporosarcina gallistercoris TaxID=2762245 RepID=UPI003D26A271